jgi:hypothetical protein
MKHRVEYRVVVGTITQALATYDHMRALAVHAAPMNAGTAAMEPAWSRVEEAVAGTLEQRRGYTLTGSGLTDDPQETLGSGPFLISGMAPYPDQSHADNAVAHAEALAQQGAAVVTGTQMAAFPGGPGRPRASVGGVHVCYHEEGLPCSTGSTFSVPLPEPSNGVDWIAGEAVTAGDVRLYQGTAYVCLQGHTTQAGWEPPNVPALWAVQ